MMAPFSSYVPHLIVFLDLGGLLSPSITAVLLPSLPELHTHTHTQLFFFPHCQNYTHTHTHTHTHTQLSFRPACWRSSQTQCSQIAYLAFPSIPSTLCTIIML